MYWYFILLFLIVGAGVLFDCKKSVGKKKFLIFSGLLLVLFSGLRNINIGPEDTLQYYYEFEEVKRLGFDQLFLFKYKDPIYHVFAKIMGNFTMGSFQTYLIIVAVIYVGSFCYLIYKYSPNVLLSVLILLTLFFYTSMYLVRQSLAIAILLFSYKYLVDRNLKKFVLLVLCAACFHRIALVFLIVYPISYLKISKTVVICYATAIILAIIYGSLLIHSVSLELIDDSEGRFARYLETDRVLSFAGFIQLGLFSILTLSFRKQALKKYPQIDILFHMLFIGMIFQSGATIIAEFFRIALFFTVFLVVLVPLSLYNIKSDGKTISVILSILLMIYYTMRSVNLEYCFFWQNHLANY